MKHDSPEDRGQTSSGWRRTGLLTLCGAAAALLGGCASLGNPTSMVDMAVNHNQTIDQIERNTLLLNILRAADEQALTFTSISYVGGNGNINSNINLNDSRRTILGSPFSFGVGGGMAVGSGFSYTLNTLDNEQFNRSFLADIPLDRLRYLHEGTYLSNSVLWTLVTQSLEVREDRGDSGHITTRIANTPAPADWSAFQRLIADALRWGLTLEEVPDEVPVGPRMSRDEAMYQITTVISAWTPPSWGPPSANAAKPMLVELGGSNATATHQLVMVGSKIRYCFKPPKIEDWPYNGEALCRSGSAHRLWRETQAKKKGNLLSPAALPLNVQEISLRSPREVFYFLGRLVRPQLAGSGVSPAMIESLEAQSSARPLIQVACDRPAPANALAVATYRDRVCHIPRDDNSHSAHVMQYLGLLVTLSKVAGAVPTSPAVLLR